MCAVKSKFYMRIFNTLNIPKRNWQTASWRSKLCGISIISFSRLKRTGKQLKYAVWFIHTLKHTMNNLGCSENKIIKPKQSRFFPIRLQAYQLGNIQIGRKELGSTVKLTLPSILWIIVRKTYPASNLWEKMHSDVDSGPQHHLCCDDIAWTERRRSG